MKQASSRLLQIECLHRCREFRAGSGQGRYVCRDGEKRRQSETPTKRAPGLWARRPSLVDLVDECSNLAIIAHFLSRLRCRSSKAVVISQEAVPPCRAKAQYAALSPFSTAIRAPSIRSLGNSAASKPRRSGEASPKVGLVERGSDKDGPGAETWRWQRMLSGTFASGAGD
jgi:hypothetical protein